ncbi:MAG: sensor histidine kinase [Bacteroidetes bacterium]|nr:sensor histidine kinase [Bacteroidota bacterium]
MPSFFQRNRVLLLHLSFWCFYISFYAYAVSLRRETTFTRFTLSILLQVSFAMLVSYFNYFVLLPRYLKYQKAWRYLIEFFIPFVILITGRVYLQRNVMEAFDIHERYFYSQFYIVQLAFDTLLITIFVAMLRFATGWFELEAKRKQMENDKLATELKFLKAQINPHFLFNTLNNLYYLAYSNSPNTTEVIAKLSQMMRYMIYDSNYPQVLLSKEIEYMKNYISLERLRLNNEVPIDFVVEGETENKLITPLIFITFLENAFKHGISANTANSWVKINIKLNGRECIYSVENSKLKDTLTDNKEKSGIGLQNLKRRLELSYAGHYTLETEEGQGRYFVQLKLTL